MVEKLACVDSPIFRNMQSPQICGCSALQPHCLSEEDNDDDNNSEERQKKRKKTEQKQGHVVTENEHN